MYPKEWFDQYHVLKFQAVGGFVNVAEPLHVRGFADKIMAKQEQQMPAVQGWFSFARTKVMREPKVGMAHVWINGECWGFVFDGMPAGSYVLRFKPGTLQSGCLESFSNEELVMFLFLEEGYVQVDVKPGRR
jgi:hypothetical protein